MSKSKLNGITPSQITKKYGSDVLRLSILFASPVDRILDWEDRLLNSQLKWLNRIDDIVESICRVKDMRKMNEKEYIALSTYESEVIKIVTSYYESMSFHTVIACLMKYFNYLIDYKDFCDTIEYKDSVKIFLRLLYPIAPFTSLEYYHRIKNDNEPEVDEIDWPKAKNINVNTIFVQINGKTKYSEKITNELNDNELVEKYKTKLEEIKDNKPKVMIVRKNDKIIINYIL